MSAILYFFTGSGNSLFVAGELQKRIPESELVPIVSLLERDVIESQAEIIGIIFPVHGLTLPVPVKKFVGKLRVNSNQYLFVVATRAGTWHNAFTEIDKTLKKRGKNLNACFTLNMASNNPKFKNFKPATLEELAHLEADVLKRLDSIQKIVVNRENVREKAEDGMISPIGNVTKNLALFGMVLMERSRANNYFYANSKCVGCGTCEKACPSRKVKMIGNKPVWQRDVTCFFCYACVNYCPKKAVQIKSKIYMKSYTENNERYTHPYATAYDIANQKPRKQQGDKA